MTKFKNTQSANHAGKPFTSEAEKELVFKQWKTFLKHGCQLKHFGQRLYQHLTLHCSFIAHFNLHGFYSTYFEDPASMQRFFTQFDNDQGNVSTEYGMTHWYNDSDYHDINKAMCDHFTANKCEVFVASGRVIRLGVYNIVVNLNGKGGTIVSDFPSTADVDDTEEDRDALLMHAAALAGVECFVLAAACAGLDIDRPDFIDSITTAVDSVDNHFAP